MDYTRIYISWHFHPKIRIPDIFCLLEALHQLSQVSIFENIHESLNYDADVTLSRLRDTMKLTNKNLTQKFDIQNIFLGWANHLYYGSLYMDPKSVRVKYPNKTLKIKFEIWVSRLRDSITQTWVEPNWWKANTKTLSKR